MIEEYKKLAKKYTLPDFELLDEEFHISFPEEEPVLIHIRRQITEKVSIFSDFLEGIMHPDTSIAGLHEASSFDEEEMQEILDLYRVLKYLERESLHTALFDSEKNNAYYIVHACKLWQDYKTRLNKILTKAKDSWNKPLKKIQDSNFFL